VNRAELQQYQRRRKNNDLRRGEEAPTARKVTQGLVNNVLQALSGLTVLPATTGQPTWLGTDGPFRADETLAAANGLVHLPTLASCPPTPRFFSPNVLDYAFDAAAARREAWLSFLNQLWPDDAQSVETLQEWFGYCLLPETRQQKMLLLVGPKRSGKGTIARVLKGLVGENNVAGPTLQPGRQLRAVAAAGQDRRRHLRRPAERAVRRDGHHRAAAVHLGRGHAHRGPQAPAAGPRQAAHAVRHLDE
jgi:putative DNA primase/helicase